MGLFDLFSQKPDFFPDPFPKKPVVFEIVDSIQMLTTDVETEGRKNGYERAAREYETVYRELEIEYVNAIKHLREQQSAYHTESEKYLNKLSSLESERGRLKEKANSKMRLTANKFDVSVSTVQSALGGSGSIISLGPSIFGMIADSRRRKMREAEKDGYAEARSLYEGKLRKLRERLSQLKESGTKKINEYISLTEEVLKEMEKIQMQIADMEILLQED